jgi:hypothetical protein
VLKKLPIRVIVIGAGDRGNVYARYSIGRPDELKIVGVAEPDDLKLKIFSEKYNIPKENIFKDYKEVFSREQFADAVFITTPDRLHYEPALMAYKKGYHILLEKPICNNPIDLIKLSNLVKNNSEQLFMICHVLRYTNFFGLIKRIIDSKELGDIVCIQHNENIGNIHFSHSFVRGNWSNSDRSSPIILAKTCHDFDILLWFTGKKIKRISSFGSLTFFTKRNKPKGAPLRCLDGCPVEKDCPYSAIKIYLSENKSWFRTVITPELSFESLYKALKEGPYGICVFQSDNNVADHQVTNILLEDDTTIAFTLCGLTSEISRTLKIMGTKAQLRASTSKNEIEITEFSTNNVKRIQVGFIEGFHYGGDVNIVKSFIKALTTGNFKEYNLTSFEDSVMSHLAAFAAEKARLENKVIDFDLYLKELNNEVKS